MAQLCFYALPPGDLKITTAPSNVQVSQGGVVRLPCVASGENVNIAWSRFVDAFVIKGFLFALEVCWLREVVTQWLMCLESHEFTATAKPLSKTLNSQ